jgi:hypothetical protein
MKGLQTAHDLFSGFFTRSSRMSSYSFSAAKELRRTDKATHTIEGGEHRAGRFIAKQQQQQQRQQQQRD